MSAATKPKKAPEPDEEIPSDVEEIREAAEDENEALLDLETIAPKRPVIKIDGKRYELRTMDDLGVSEQARRDRQGTEFRTLFEKKNPTQGDEERMKELLDRLFDEVLLAPEEIKARLSDYQKQQVVVTFTAAPLMARMRQEEKEAKEKEEQGGSSTTES